MSLSRLLDLSKITDTTWWADVRSDGGDLRATDDGNIQLPLSILAFDQATKTGVVAVLTDDATTAVRIWIGTGGTVQPAADAALGSEAAFADGEIAYWPAGSGTDVSGNDKTLGDSVHHVTDNTLYHGAIVTKVINDSVVYTLPLTPGSAHTVEFWFNVNGSGNVTVQLAPDPTPAASNGNVIAFLSLSANATLLDGAYFHGTYDSNPDLITDSSSSADATTLEATWQHGVLAWDDVSPVALYVNGVVQAGTGTSGALSGVNELALTLFADLGETAKIALFGVYSEKKSSAWAAARYSGYATPAGVGAFAATDWPH